MLCCASSLITLVPIGGVGTGRITQALTSAVVSHTMLSRTARPATAPRAARAIWRLVIQIALLGPVVVDKTPALERPGAVVDKYQRVWLFRANANARIFGRRSRNSGSEPSALSPVDTIAGDAAVLVGDPWGSKSRKYLVTGGPSRLEESKLFQGRRVFNRRYVGRT